MQKTLQRFNNFLINSTEDLKDARNDKIKSKTRYMNWNRGSFKFTKDGSRVDEFDSLFLDRQMDLSYIGKALVWSFPNTNKPG